MSKLIRTSHRWLSMFFMATVIITAVALSLPEPIVWVSYIPLAPLFLLMASGCYMFFQPYVARWRAGRTS
jgi:predicted Na+-dependent transporter